ncbi:MAG: N-acetylmuramoyl-L-alanine amidase [Bacteroidota bacterium]
MNIEFENDFLKGVRREHQATKNTAKFEDIDNAKMPDTIVIHYTAGRDAETSAKYLADPKVEASAHLVIGRDGTIFQLASFKHITWHAGVSHYQDRKGLNKYSIGIELDNAGPLIKTGNVYKSWFGGTYSEDQVVFATHRNENQPRYWHTYTEVQISVCEEICRALIEKYGITKILGHEEISVGRKTDPGPAFQLDRFREHLLSHNRKTDDEKSVSFKEGMVITDKLNIRADAGANFPLVAMPLKEGHDVEVLEEANGWYKVETKITGWVNKAYIGPKKNGKP